MAYQSQLSQLIELKNPLNSKISSQNNNNEKFPIYEITLEFSNNLFQTFLIEIEEKNGIFIRNLSSKILPQFPYNKNTLKITYQNDTYFIIFQNKQDFLDNVNNS